MVINMIVLYMLIMAVYAILWLVSFRAADGGAGSRGFERIAEFAYLRLKQKGLCQGREVREELRAIHPEKKDEQELGQYYIKKLKLVLLVVFVGNLLACCLFLTGWMEGQINKEGSLERNGYGMGSQEAFLRVEIRGGEQKSEEFTLTIEEQQYEEALVKEMAKEASALLPTAILGSNPSLSEVRSSLNLVHNLEGYPFHISWESDNYACIYSDGTIINEEIEKGGEVVSLTAMLSYGTYVERVVLPVHVYPPLYSQEEIFREKVYQALVEQEKAGRYSTELLLPKEVEGKDLVWSKVQEDSSGYLLLVTGIGAVSLYLSGDKDLRKKVQKRNRQMLSDYPQLMTKLILYMGAGITIRNAFRKIASDYCKERDNGSYHYVYEEMLLTCHELDSGISEALAYERFGKRCRLPQYNKFANLLTQSLKRGGTGLQEELRHEAETAFEDRRNLAKKLGEEAGTKLLLPMMLMLGIVMILIMIPAYFSFSV